MKNWNSVFRWHARHFTVVISSSKMSRDSRLAYRNSLNVCLSSCGITVSKLWLSAELDAVFSLCSVNILWTCFFLAKKHFLTTDLCDPYELWLWVEWVTCSVALYLVLPMRWPLVNAAFRRLRRTSLTSCLQLLLLSLFSYSAYSSFLISLLKLATVLFDCLLQSDSTEASLYESLDYHCKVFT